MSDLVSISETDDLNAEQVQALIEESNTKDFEVNYTPFQGLPNERGRTGSGTTHWTPRIEAAGVIIPAQTAGGANRMIEYAPAIDGTDTFFENARGKTLDYRVIYTLEMWARGCTAAGATTSLTTMALGAVSYVGFSTSVSAASVSAFAHIRAKGTADYAAGQLVEFFCNDGDPNGAVPTTPTTVASVTRQIDPYFKIDWNPYNRTVSAYTSSRSAGGGWVLLGSKDTTIMRQCASAGFFVPMFGFYVHTGSDTGGELFPAVFRNMRVRILDYQGAVAT